MIRWFANNEIAANFLMVGLLLAGVYTAFFRVPLEVEPSRNYGGVYFSMPYRGGTAKDVEKAILIPVEEALEGINGVKMIDADGYRGRARIWIDAEEGYDLRVLIDDIQSRVDGITTFPQETERPEIRIPDSSLWHEVLSVAVTGRLDDKELRKVARRVQEDLLEIDGISIADMAGERNFEISIEAHPEKLSAYNISLAELATAVRRSSVDLPAGSIQSESGSLVVRTRGQAYNREQFGNIPVRAGNGAEVLLKEIAKISDGFEEGDKIVEFNGKPALFVEVMRTGLENAIDVSDKVKEYVRTSASKFPDGIELFTFEDESIAIRGRLSALISSLLQGSLLVFLVLGLFLRPQLAFWVVIGIPVCFAGGVLLMPWFGITANVMSLFGFIIVVGVVVDDAIVTGENIFSKMRTGMDPLEASIVGTHEVAVPVTFGVLTTVVAFLPLMFFEGHWGNFAKQIPPVVAPVLLFSLVESKLILPAHLKHLRIAKPKRNPILILQERIANTLELFVAKVYQPMLAVALRQRAIVLAGFTAMALTMAGYSQGGRLGFVSMPSVDRLKVSAYFALPSDTSIEVTHSYVQRLVQAAEKLQEEFIDPGTGESLIKNILTVSGARHIQSSYDKSRGYVAVEVIPPSLRTEPGPRNAAIAKRWGELVGPIPEARYFRIRGEESGGRDDDREQESLELELRGPSSEAKNAIAERIADHLNTFDGVSKASADVNYGQDELEFTLKPRATEMGLTQQSLAQQIRQAFFGEEAQRILRQTDDVRVMVRLPRAERESLYTIDRMKIRTPSGAEVPLSTVANLSFVRAPSQVERRDGAEIISISGQPDDDTVDIIGIADELSAQVDEMIADHPELSYVFTGYVAEAAESRKRTLIGSIALLFALYALLAIPFKSMTQPLYVLVAVPFGIIGALLGHIFMGITPSYLSIFGMLALAGVVVNDSLVLVDFVNRQVRAGTPLDEAVLTAGGRRFRPILLTSITTFVGLIPLLMDTSIQAQFLIPMAVSLGFGVLFATAITLVLVPCALLMGRDIGRLWNGLRDWFIGPFRTTPS